MSRRVAVFLLPLVDALVLGPVLRAPTVSRARATAPCLGLFDSLFDKGSSSIPGVYPVETLDNPSGFSMEELSALQAASISLVAPARGMADPPKALLDGT